MLSLPPRRTRGSALIISIAVLAVLALISISFARLMQVERASSQNFRLTVQARMNAESGIEQAVAWFNHPDNAQPGYSRADLLSAPWIYRNDADDDVGQGIVDLSTAENPSFEFLETPHCSGELEVDSNHPSLRNTRNFYKLKVVDTSSQINLNSSIAGDALLDSLLRRMLRALGLAIETVFATPANRPVWWPAGVAVPNPFPELVIGAIIAERNSLPNLVFREKEQIRPFVEANGALSAAQADLVWQLVEDYVTVWGWQNDRSVAAAEPTFQFYDGPLTWYRALGSVSAWGRKAVSLGEILPLFEPKFPININTAPKVVLISNLLGIGGSIRRMDKAAASAGNPALGGDSNFLKIDYGSAGTTLTMSVFAQIEALVDAIIAYRSSATVTPIPPAQFDQLDGGSFTTWAEFYQFLEWTGTLAGFGWLGREERDLILASANPNWMTNQQIPERHRYFTASRLYLLNSLTEFTFTPVGYFEIESLGWVQGPTGETTAESRIRAIVRAWDLIYRSSQRDFLDELQSAENTTTGPEPINNVISSTTTFGDDPRLPDLYGGSTFAAQGGNPYEGWVQALTEDIATTRSGGALSFSETPDSDADVVFYQPFRFDPARAGSPWNPAKETVKSAERGYQGEGAGPDLWKKTGETIFRGESLAPDGAMFFNYNDEEISFSAAAEHPHHTHHSFRPDYGTVDFWLKFPAGFEAGRTGSDWGSHEALAYITQSLGTFTVNELGVIIGSPQTANLEIGVTWKLERYGFKIRSTRFLWMNFLPAFLPDVPLLPTMPPAPDIAIKYLWTEVEFDLSNHDWNDNEWHHFAHSWTSFTEQAVFVDGTRVGYVLDALAPKQGPGSFAIPYTVTPADPEYTTRFELVSINPDDRAHFGGIIYERTNTGTTVYRGKTDDANKVTVRMSNSKMDEIRSYNFHINTESGANYNKVCNKLRFEPISGDPFHEGELTFDRGGRVTLVRFTTLRSGTATVRFTTTINGSTTTVVGDIVDTGGVTVTAGQTMTYRMTFLLGSGSNSTPIVDDMTVYVAVTPSFVSYQVVYDR